MKVSDLIDAIERSKEEYPDFLDWNVALEQHPNYKECSNCKDSVVVSDDFGIKTEYIKSHAGQCVGVYWLKDKTFGINIHY